MNNEFDISIAFELRIKPIKPLESTAEKLKIAHAELSLTHHSYTLIKALEEKLNSEFDLNDIYKYGIKPIDLVV